MVAVMARWHTIASLSAVDTWTGNYARHCTQQRRYGHGVQHLSCTVHRWKNMALRGVVQLWVVKRHLNVMHSTNSELDTLTEGTTSLAHEVAYLSLLYRDTAALSRRQRVLLLQRMAVRLMTRDCCRFVHMWWQQLATTKLQKILGHAGDLMALTRR